MKIVREDLDLPCLGENEEQLKQLVAFAVQLRHGGVGCKPHQQWKTETVKKFKELYG